MLKRILCMLLIAVMLTGLLNTGTSSAAEVKPARTITIFKVSGSDVKMTKGTEKEFKAKADLKLYDGYTVSTGSGSYCYLKLDDGSLIKIDEKSKIQVSKASSKKLSISVLSGGLTVDAEKQDDGDEVEVRVGNSALAIRGTYFAAENMPDGKAVYTMFEGSGDVDGHNLSHGYVMYVYDKAGGTGKSAGANGDSKPNQVHELQKLEINKDMSAFVLQTVLDDTSRFIENGIITEKDIISLKDFLEMKRREAMNNNELAAVIGRTIYYELLNSGNYNGGLDTGTITVDKSDLQSKLQLVYAIKRGVFVSDSEENVDYGRKWVTKEVMDSLNTAIKAAEDLLDAKATIQQVRDAVDTLSMEAIRFGGSVETNPLGTRPVSVNTAALESAIENAYGAKIGIFVNTNSSNVQNRKIWVKQDDMNTLNTALAAAEAALNTAASLIDVTAAANELDTAIDIFNRAKQTGTNLDPIDSDLLDARNELETALINAYKAKLTTLVRAEAVYARTFSLTLFSDDYSSKVDIGKKWVTNTEMQALNSSITNAENAFNKISAQPDESEKDTVLSSAKSAANNLVSAVNVFIDVKKDGTRPLSLDKSLLEKSIDNAYEAKSEVSVSAGADDVYLGSQWVTAAEMRAANDAIAAAEDAYMFMVAVKQDVIDAANKLDNAVKVFNAAKKPGNKVLDFDELVYAIKNAEEALGIIDNIKYFIDTNGRNTYWHDFWVTKEAAAVLEAAIDKAFGVLSIAGSQMDIRNAVNDLEWETKIFTWSIRPGSKKYKEEETETKVWRNTRTNVEYSSFLNAVEAAQDNDNLVLFGDAVISGLRTSYPINIIINAGVTLEIDETGVLSYIGTFTNNGTITNNGSLWIACEQTFTNNGTVNNNKTIVVEGARTYMQQGYQKQLEDAVFINNGIFDNNNNANLNMNGVFTSKGIFNNKTGAVTNMCIDEYERANGIPAFEFTGTSSMVNDGSFIVRKRGILSFTSNSSLLNNGELVVGVQDGGELNFSSAGLITNNGVFIIIAAGKFIYNSINGIIVNNAHISWLLTSGSIEIYSDMKIVGGAGAYIEANSPIENIGRWDVSNFYDGSGNQMTDNIPNGAYHWDEYRTYWKILDRSALEAAIMSAEAAKEGFIFSLVENKLVYKANDGRWVELSDMSSLSIAIDNAKVASAKAATQQEIDAEAAKVISAVDIFKAAIKGGSLALDTRALKEAIADAEALIDEFSIPFLNGIYLNADNNYVDSNTILQLVFAIATAEDVLAGAAAQQEVTSAISKLQNAIETFKANILP